jgi:hypothetical protein
MASGSEPGRYAAPVRLWPFRRKPRQEHYLGEYTEPSFRGAIFMLVVSVVVLALLWLAYSWALGRPNVPDPNGLLDGVGRMLAVLSPT